MKNPALWLAFSLSLSIGIDAAAEPVTLTASDGVTVYGEYWVTTAGPTNAGPTNAGPPKNPHAPVIVAFHQAGSNHAEYAPLATRLNQAGFDVLAIDQRSGGSAFGGKNRTAAQLGHSTGFEGAFPDLEAALAWGRAKAGGAPVLVWGSSYSAALVFRLAALHPADVQGLLAFSPSEYLKNPMVVRTSARELRIPVFIDQAEDDDEIAAARRILDAVASVDKTQYRSTRGGVHGSATLRSDRNPGGAEENWTAVLAFLAKFKQPH